MEVSSSLFRAASAGANCSSVLNNLVNSDCVIDSSSFLLVAAIGIHSLITFLSQLIGPTLGQASRHESTFVYKKRLLVNAHAAFSVLGLAAFIAAHELSENSCNRSAFRTINEVLDSELITFATFNCVIERLTVSIVRPR